MPDGGLYGALLVTGFLGSLGHCLGMCGPLMMMVGLQARSRGRTMLPCLALYHAARVAVYAGLGAVLGIIGSFVDLAAQLSSLAGGLSLVFGLGVALVGLGYLGALPVAQIDALSGRVSAGMAGALKRGGVWGFALLGGLTGLLPCCLVYGALLMAGASAAPAAAALGMACFGLGTTPALLATGLGAGLLGVQLRQTLSRVSGAFLLVVGLQLGLRGLAELHLVPHLQVGTLVLW